LKPGMPADAHLQLATTSGATDQPSAQQ